MKKKLPSIVLGPLRFRQDIGVSYVYGLFDSRDESGRPFYIGATSYFENRAVGHVHGANKGVARRRLEIEAADATCTMAAMKAFDCPVRAQRYEKKLIRELPNLLNVEGRPR